MFGIGKKVRITGVGFEGEPIDKMVSMRELNKYSKEINTQDLYLIEVFVGSSIERWIVGVDVEKKSCRRI